MPEKVFKDGKLVVIKSGTVYNPDSPQPLNIDAAKKNKSVKGGSDRPENKKNEIIQNKPETGTKEERQSVPPGARQANPQQPDNKKISYSSIGRNNEPVTEDIIKCIQELSAEGSSESIINLIQYFSHPKWLARKMASDALVRFGEKAIPYITQTLFLSPNSLDEDSLYWSIRTFGEIGAPATTGLITILNASTLPKSYKLFAVRAFEKCVCKEGVLTLINCFSDESWVIRREAGSILMKMGEFVVPYLKNAFSSGNEDVRYWSVKVLGGILGKGAIEYFKKMLKSDKRDMRYFATAALGEIDDDEALDALAVAFSDDSWLVRAQVSEILEKKGKAALRVLKKVFEDGSSDAKFLSIKLMGKVMGKGAISYISKLISRADTELKFFALSALSETLDETAIPTLIDALSDNVWLVRKHASSLLEKFGPKAISFLVENLKKTEDENLRYWSIVSLCNVGNPATSEIRKLLNAADKKEKTTIIQCLKPELTIELMNMLFDCFADKHWPVRNEAYKKLSEVADYLVPTIFEYHAHKNPDIKYWTGQLIKNNQTVLAKSLFTCINTDSNLGELGETLKQCSLKLLLSLTQPDVVENSILHAINTNDATLLSNLKEGEFFNSMLQIYMSEEFESKHKGLKSFVYSTLKESLDGHFEAVRAALNDPDCSKEKIIRLLVDSKNSSLPSLLADFVNSDDRSLKKVSLKYVMENIPDDENIYGSIIEAFKSEDEKGRLNFINELPAIKNTKMLKALTNQFRVLNETDCAWIARLIIEWNAQGIDDLNAIAQATSDPKIKFWIGKVINHVNGTEFL